MRITRRRNTKGTKKLDVFRRVRKMIFPSNHVRDFHLHVVNHVDEMKNPRAIRTADGHVRVDFLVREIEIDLAANEIVDHYMLAGRTKPQRALIVEDVTGILQFLQVALVNGRRGFFGVAGAISIFHPQNKCAAVMSSKKPVEERGPRAADVEIAGG